MRPTDSNHRLPFPWLAAAGCGLLVPASRAAVDTNKALVIVPPQNGGTNAIPANADIRPNKPPVAISNPWVWAAWLLGLALLAALGWWWWRRRRRLAATPAPTIIIPPHVRARDRLRRAMDFMLDPERFCVAVSQAIREYLEERFDLHAPERTTEEFLEELQTSPKLSLEQKRLLTDFLARCDLVKFARYAPSEDELKGLWDVAMRIVEETTPEAGGGFREGASSPTTTSTSPS